MLKKVRVWIVAVMAILMISLLACSDITGVAEVVSEGNSDSTEVVSETESETDTETSENTSEESDSEDETSEEVKEEASEENTTAESGTPFEMHGALKVDGTNVVDANGDVFQIAGVSTHGLAWFPDYVNKDAFMSIRDDWGANTIRLAMYTATAVIVKAATRII